MTGESVRDADDPQSFYDEYADREWDRLEGRIDGRLERTVRRTAEEPVVADLSIHMLAVGEA